MIEPLETLTLRYTRGNTSQTTELTVNPLVYPDTITFYLNEDSQNTPYTKKLLYTNSSNNLMLITRCVASRILSSDIVNGQIKGAKAEASVSWVSAKAEIESNNIYVYAYVKSFPQNDYDLHTITITTSILYQDNVILSGSVELDVMLPLIIMLNTDMPDMDEKYDGGPLDGIPKNIGVSTRISYNPEALAICHTKGWCSETLMTNIDAYAVTDSMFKGAFKDSAITHFDELKYFIHITRIEDDEFKNCANLYTISVPENVTYLPLNPFPSTIRQVTYYNREAELGDYVYADGSYSNVLDNNKTVVGIAYWIAPDKHHGMCVATSNTYTGCWGLHNIGSYTNTSTDMFDVVLTDEYGNRIKYRNTNDNYSAYDIRDLVDADNYNISLSEMGFLYRGNTSTVTQTVIDNLGFEADGGYLPDLYKLGDTISASILNTLYIMYHRDIVLHNIRSIGPLDSPKEYISREGNENKTEKTALDELIVAVKAEGNEIEPGYSTKYAQFYYPAASYCNVYVPSIKSTEILADKFKIHNWSLPAHGDIYRCYSYYTQYRLIDTRDESPFTPAILSGKFTNFTVSHFWSSTENSYNRAWRIDFGNSDVNYNEKSNTDYVARAVAAF